MQHTVQQFDCLKFYENAVHAVLPAAMVHECLKTRDDKLVINQTLSFSANSRIIVLAFGKAVLGMVRAVENVLGDHLSEGIASVPIGSLASVSNESKQEQQLEATSNRVEIIEGALNNNPDEASHKAATAIYGLAQSLNEDDIALVLISGGGSALLPLPVPPITIEELVQLTTLLARKGATINELNIVRKHVEILKGGGLARVAYPARVISLILSDVIEDPLDIIASGPTTIDTSTADDALSIVRKYGLESSVSQSVVQVLKSQAKQNVIANCNVSNDEIFARVLNVIMGSNSIALKAAESTATQQGYLVHLITTALSGTVHTVSLFYRQLIETILVAAAMDSLEENHISKLMQWNIVHTDSLSHICTTSGEALKAGRSVCLLAGGEPVVRVTGQGRGGRCQELCLTAAKHLAQVVTGDTSYDVTLLCAGTDGQDGPTDAAGALINQYTAAQAADQGLDIDQYLNDNDSYGFFSRLNNGNNLIKTGPTGTNVMDIHIILMQARKI